MNLSYFYISLSRNIKKIAKIISLIVTGFPMYHVLLKSFIVATYKVYFEFLFSLKLNNQYLLIINAPRNKLFY